MTGVDSVRFSFGGLQAEFKLWLDAIQGVPGVPGRAGAGAGAGDGDGTGAVDGAVDGGGASGGHEAADLTPEQGLVDLVVIEALCRR